MSDSYRAETESERSLDNTNFRLSDLSSAKTTIWNDYFLKSYASIPAEAIAPSGGKETTVVHPSPANDEPIPSLLHRLSTLRGKVSSRPNAAFSRKFYAKETFRGLVVALEPGGFRAAIRDKAGDQYEKIFRNDEIPEPQRAHIRIGTPVVVHIGFEYRGSTRTNLLKIFLGQYEKNTSIRDRLIKEKAASWDF